MEVGYALLEIRERRLYRENFNTFAEYCKARWNFTERHATRLLTASKVAADLEPIGAITHETQTRPLVLLGPEQRKAVWTEALKLNPQPSERQLRAVVQRLGFNIRSRKSNQKFTFQDCRTAVERIWQITIELRDTSDDRNLRAALELVVEALDSCRAHFAALQS